METVRFEELKTPSTQFREISRVDAEPLERFAARLIRSSGHGGVNSAHVYVHRIEQQCRAVGICVQPTLESNLFKVLWLPRARLDLGFVQILEISLLPVVGDGADCGNIQAVRRLHVRGVIEPADESIGGDVYGA